MSVPVSKGIGTGAAQVFEQDKTYQALQGMAGRKMQLDDQAKKDKKEAEKEALIKREKAAKAAQIPFDSTGILSSQIPEYYAAFEKINEQFKGRWHLASDDPVVANELSVAVAGLNAVKNDLMNQKVIADGYRDLVNNTKYENYNDDERIRINELYNKQGVNWNDISLKRTEKIEDPVKDSTKFFDEDLSVFYSPDRTYGLKLLSDEENFETWKAAVLSAQEAGDWLERLNASKRYTDAEDKLRAGYEDFKSRYLTSKLDYNTSLNRGKTKTKDKKIWGVDEGDVRAYYFNENGKEGVAFSNVGNVAIKGISYSGTREQYEPDVQAKYDAAKERLINLEENAKRAKGDAKANYIKKAEKEKEIIKEIEQNNSKSNKEYSANIMPTSIISLGGGKYQIKFYEQTESLGSGGEAIMKRGQDKTETITSDSVLGRNLLIKYGYDSLDEFYDAVKSRRKGSSSLNPDE